MCEQGFFVWYNEVMEDFIKPAKGLYRVVDIPNGKESKVEVYPADKSVRLVEPAGTSFSRLKVLCTLFDNKDDCRLKYEGTEQYSFRFWDEESFTVDTEYGPVFFELMAKEI